MRIEGRLAEDSGGYAICGRPYHTLDLSPWRRDGGPWEPRLLRVDVPARPRREGWRRGEVVALDAARPTLLRDRNLRHAYLAGGRPPVRRTRTRIDPQDVPAPPRTITTPLGRLRLDEAVGCYGTWKKRTRGEYEIGIRFDGAAGDPRPAALRGATVAGLLERSLPTLCAAAAAELAPFHARSWRGEGPAVLPASMAARLAFASITVELDGSAEVILDADGLFGAHAACLAISTQGRVARVSLV